MKFKVRNTEVNLWWREEAIDGLTPNVENATIYDTADLNEMYLVKEDYHKDQAIIVILREDLLEPDELIEPEESEDSLDLLDKLMQRLDRRLKWSRGREKNRLQKYKGKERDFNFWGGRDQGYYEGRVSSYEDIRDEFLELIEAHQVGEKDEQSS